MAKRVGVIEGSGISPKTYVKKSVAMLLVRRLLAVWEIEHVSIRRLAIRVTDAIPAAELTPKPRTYIPEHLPANIDAMLGVIDQSPVLAEQIRFRHV